MKSFLESKKSVTSIGAPDAKIVFTRVLFIQYEQFLLDKNFRHYIETIMISKKILRMCVQKAYEISAGSESLTVEFYGSNRQFNWLELSLVYDKNDKHLKIYDSYNVELAAKIIKSLALENFTEAYSLTNEKKYDISNTTHKHLLFKQFVAWSCNGCSVAPFADYLNNPISQKLSTESEYFSLSDESVYLDFRANYGYTKETKKLESNGSKFSLKIQLKSAATKKLRLRIWRYSLDEYLYILAKDGLMPQHKTYSITSEDNDFE